MQKQVKTSKQPMLSVIVPVYNSEKFITSCIESILAQTYQNFELIIIDDGSVDNTPKILKKFSKKDARIKLFNSENKGVSAARNFGLDAAKGKYITFIDSDDYIDKRTFKTVIQEIEKQDTDCLLFNYKNLSVDGFESIRKQKIFDKTKPTIYELLFDSMVTVWAKVFKNDEKLPRFNENLAKMEDLSFLFEYYLKEPKISLLDKAFYVYRNHLSAATKDIKLILKGATFKSAKYCLSLAKNEQEKNIIIDRFCLSVLREIDQFFKNQLWPKEYRRYVYEFLTDAFCFNAGSIPNYLSLCQLCKKQIWMSFKTFFFKEKAEAEKTEENIKAEKEQFEEPVDLIYTWVDGNDKKWQKEKAKWIKKLGLEMDDALNDCRFVDNQELKYSLRSAMKNAPWINHIYIVTNGQIPKWFKKHSKITFIKHEDIMPKDALPTFNSIAIESCLANIKGLSEYFLYSNDDCFFYKPVEKSFFFDEKGNPIVRLVPQNWSRETIETRNYPNNISYVRDLIKKKYGKDYPYEGTHNIVPGRKSYYLKCAKQFRKEFDRVCHHKFRQMDAIQKTIYDFWILANDLGILKIENPDNQPCNAKVIRLKTEGVMRSELNKYKPYLFCVNDNEETSLADRPNLKYFLCSLFPTVQPWEKQTDYQIYPAFDEKNAFVFCLDDRYCRYFGVALQSLIDHADENKNYDIVVFATDLSYKNKNLLLKMIPSNFCLRFYNISEYTNEQFSNIKFFAVDKWSISIFYRLFIPFVMKNYEKILYLDSDICINKNIDELFEMQMKKCNLLAVKDTVSPILYKHKERKKQMECALGLEHPENYFNSGVLMFHIKNIDLEYYKNEMCHAFKISGLLFPDQDILNIIFQNSVKFISAKYNYIYGSCSCGLKYLSQINGEYKKDFLEARADPYIIHFTNPKPWAYPSKEYADVFWHYARRSPYYEEIIYANTYDRCVKIKK